MDTGQPPGMESKRRSLFNGFLGCAWTRLDLRQPDLKIWTGQSILFDGDCIRRLSRKAQRIGIAPEGEIAPPLAAVGVRRNPGLCVSLKSDQVGLKIDRTFHRQKKFEQHS